MDFTDLVERGLAKRKLTRKEAKQVTAEVMAMGLESPDARFTMAMIRAMDAVNG